MGRLRQRLIDELQLRGRAPKTIKSYVAAVAQLAQYFHRSPANLTNEEVRSFLLHLIQERAYATSTVNVRISALKFFYAEVLGRTVPVLVLRPKRPRPAPVVLNQQEVRAILCELRVLRVRSALTTAYACGLRLGEVIQLRPEHIDEERVTLTVELGKGQKGRVLPMPRWALRVLKAYLWTVQPSKWVFPSSRRDGPMDPSTLQKGFQAARKAAKIDKPASVHTLRHSYATHLLDYGVSPRAVQELLGHSSLKTTMRYLHVTGKTMDRLYVALESLGEGLSPQP